MMKRQREALKSSSSSSTTTTTATVATESTSSTLTEAALSSPQTAAAIKENVVPVVDSIQSSTQPKIQSQLQPQSNISTTLNESSFASVSLSQNLNV